MTNSRQRPRQRERSESGLVESMARGWNRFWFQPGSAVNLAANRIIFFGWIFYFAVAVDFAGWGEIARETDLFWMPTPVFELLGLRPISPATLNLLQTVWKVSLLTSCVGLAARASLWTSFLLGFYFFGLPHNFGKIHHNDTLIVLIMAVLAMSRATDVWTLDGLIKRLWGSKGRTRTVAVAARPGGEYTWPVRAVWVLMTIVFFSAGYSKLAYSGLDWAFSDNLRRTLVAHFYSHHPPTRLGLHIAQFGLLCQGAAVATLVLELGAPLALLSRRMRRVFPAGLFCMQIGIWVLLGVNFFNYFVCYFFWIPWDRVIPGASPRQVSSSVTRTTSELADGEPNGGPSREVVLH